MPQQKQQCIGMEFSYVIYAAVAFFFLFYLWSSVKPKIGTDTPPEAGGARPFTGHLHLMSGGSAAELPHINLATLADTYGPVFTIRLGVQRALVVSSSELIKELFTTFDAVISTRARLRTTRHLSYDFAMFGFSPYGAYWRELRKLVNVEILSARRIELQRDVRVSETSQAVNGIYKLWEKGRDGSGRVLVDMKERLADLSFNVIFRTVAGKRFSGGDDAEERLHHQLMRDLFHLAGTFVPADAFPFLAWLDLGGHEKRSKETADKLDEIFGGWVEEHREKENSGGDGPRDFIDLMLSVKLGENLQGQYDADTIIKSTCLSLLLGGSDTTTVMLVWALSLLLNNRRVLRKAQEEVDTQVGKERRVKESDVNNLVYLQAVVKETLRLYPAGPLGGVREFAQDCRVGGYHVPKGTWLIVNLWKLHRDPQVWSDPMEFRPERFLNDSTDVTGKNFEFVPFGAGRRICPGMYFALRTLHFVLASFLQAFDFSTVSDEEVDMTGSMGLTNMKATPLHLLIAPRLSPGLYDAIEIE